MNIVQVQKLHPNATIPSFAHDDDSGADATTPEEVVIQHGDTAIVPLGISLCIPWAHEIQGRPRSGLSSKGVLVAFGTVDEGYRGELKAIVSNFSGSAVVFPAGTKIVQLVLAPRVRCSFREVSKLEGFSTSRGNNGFGSTDK